MMPRKSICLLFLTLALCGCDSNPARFPADRLSLVANEVGPGQARDIAYVVKDLFGTPNEPKLPEEAPELAELISIDHLRQAAGVVASHAVGENVGLYRRHCARCHGVAGDGRGPTALYQHPYPRDFRRGVFKFTSTPRGVPPTDADLHATLERGVPGTAMPSFALLTQQERDALVDYVKYLSIRGQVEQELIDFAGDELEYDPITGEEGPGIDLTIPEDHAFVFGDVLTSVVQRWMFAKSRVINPPPPPANFPEGLVAQGERLFANQRRLGCITCHAEEDTKTAPGLVALKDYDLWNARRRDFEMQTDAYANQVSYQLNQPSHGGWSSKEVTAALRELAARRGVAAEMLPPVASRPRRLGEQALRGGADPDDLFRHIQQGVDGTPMPSVVGVLSDEEVWALVAYVLEATATGTGGTP